jgi:two-component system nitrate/nitrite response regulator NarL
MGSANKVSLDVVPSSRRTTVFLADASPLDCRLLAASLGQNRMAVIGWAVNSTDVISGIANHKPDVAVISSRLQDGELAGLSALGKICRLQPESQIVMLLDSSQPGLVIEAFRNGAAGVFSRAQKLSDLCKCIRCVLTGQVWASNQEVRYLVEALRMHPAARITTSKGIALLTKREAQIVNLVANGLTNREIAEQLRLSKHTVKNYLIHIFEKLEISTRVELALYAISQQRTDRDVRR